MSEEKPFSVRFYVGSDAPELRGMGFDGLRIGDDREDAQEFVDWLNTQIESIDALKAEVERLRKDAERYRWMVHQPETAVSRSIQTMWANCKTNYPSPAEWDAAIDAAMKGKS